MTHTFLVTIDLDDDEDLQDVEDEIYDALSGPFGPDTTVKAWSPHSESLPPEL